MTKRDIATLALKVLGIWVFVAMVIPLVMFTAGIAITFKVLKPEGWQVGLVLALLVQPPLLVLLFLVAFMLTFGTERICRWLLPDFAEEPVSATASSADIQGIAFSCIGLAIFVWGLLQFLVVLPAFRQHLRDMLYSKGPSVWWIVHHWDEMGPFLARIVALVLGIALFFGGRGLAKFWHRLCQPVFRQDRPEASPEKGSPPSHGEN
jgi:hypothetical protein